MNGFPIYPDSCGRQPEVAAAVAGLSDELQARFAVYEREERARESGVLADWHALDRVLGDARERGEQRRAIEEAEGRSGRSGGLR